MKNKSLIIIGIILSLIINTTIYGEEAFEYNEPIRVGLKQLYNNVTSLNIYNKSIAIGYGEDSEFEAAAAIYSSTGFIGRGTTYSFVVVNEDFYTYDEVLKRARAIELEGYTTYTASVEKGLWRVYIGNAIDHNEAQTLYEQLSNNGYPNCTIVDDNGYRVMLDLKGTPPILFENSGKDNMLIKANTITDNVRVLDLGERSYRGQIELYRSHSNSIKVINVVSLQDYLFSVLPSEMPRTFPKEALKAQAVAARNYVIYYKYVVSKYPNEPYDVCDTTSCQVYKGFNYEHEETNQAVLETKEKLIYYNDDLIIAFFFSTSGGHTENSENVWSTPVDYLKGKPDLYETTPEKPPWVLRLSGSDIQSKLVQNGINVGTVQAIEVTSYTSAGRAMGLKITGSNGEHTVYKETMRYWFGLNSRRFTLVEGTYNPNVSLAVMNETTEVVMKNYNDLYVIDSNQQTVRLNDGKEQVIILSADDIVNYPVISGQDYIYTFAGMGWGHGIGMSQSGAKGMALAGFTYDEILEYYYDKTNVR